MFFFVCNTEAARVKPSRTARASPAARPRPPPRAHCPQRTASSDVGVGGVSLFTRTLPAPSAAAGGSDICDFEPFGSRANAAAAIAGMCTGPRAETEWRRRQHAIAAALPDSCSSTSLGEAAAAMGTGEREPERDRGTGQRGGQGPGQSRGRPGPGAGRTGGNVGGAQRRGGGGARELPTDEGNEAGDEGGESTGDGADDDASTALGSDADAESLATHEDDPSADHLVAHALTGAVRRTGYCAVLYCC